MRWGLKVIFALVLIALLVAVIVRIGQFALKIAVSSENVSAVRDPMFAEEPETVLPPSEDEATYEPFEDNSDQWDIPERTPVDRTAEELGEEARAAFEIE